jgi:hypothetical protein
MGRTNQPATLNIPREGKPQILGSQKRFGSNELNGWLVGWLLVSWLADLSFLKDLFQRKYLQTS